jgi:magnesium-transporting ATPase (P-type)
MLGFADQQSTRIITLTPEALEEMRIKVKNNIVTTSMYNWYSFLPVNLFQQLSKAANIYFIIITILQTIKVVSISGGEPTMLPPLVLVIACSMFKDGYEDYCRHVEDATENNAICTRFNRKNGTWEKIRWGDVLVGDFIKVA